MGKRGSITGIVILASCEHHFIRVLENLVQHPSNNISIGVSRCPSNVIYFVDIYLLKLFQLPIEKSILYREKGIKN